MAQLKSSRKRNNLILFSLSIIYIFGLGLFEGLADMHFVYYSLISAIYITAIITVKDAELSYFYAPFILVILTWVTEFIDLPLLSEITGSLSTLFFIFVIVLLIQRVGKSKSVSSLEFLESINVYLLIGIAGSILFYAIYKHNPESFNHPGEHLGQHSDFIYFSFVTLATLGYGDITPVDSLARSLAILFSVTGQLYLTMIIAMLVGKFIGQETEKKLKK